MIAWRSALSFSAGVIAVDDVAVFTDLDLFDPQLSFTALALENERNHRCRVLEHDVVDHAARAFAGPLTFSSAAMASALIMPRSATTQARVTPKRVRSRCATGNRTVTSAVLPGTISVQIGRPSASMTSARIICAGSGGSPWNAQPCPASRRPRGRRTARWCP